MITYKAGYKYQLIRADAFLVNIVPENEVDTQFISLDMSGMLQVKRGYAWDGPSGPTLDSKSAMQASLVHDALYGLMRDGFIMGEKNRRKADKVFYMLLKRDGMWKIRAKVWYRSVRRWAKNSSINGRPILEAP